MSYTIHDVRRELIRAHGGKKVEFVLDQIQQWGFPFQVESIAPRRFVGSDQGLKVASHASSAHEAALWAIEALREWAFHGVRDRGHAIGGRNYFGEITRRWAKHGPGSITVPGSLGGTLDWLYLFSRDASKNPTDRMYPVFSRDQQSLFNLYFWVFADLWSGTGIDRPAVNIASDHGLHPVFWDSEPQFTHRDQTHHFAAFFWWGAYNSSSYPIVMGALAEIGDARFDPTTPELFEIVNRGDVALGLLAAQWGDKMKTTPGYLGHEVAESLRSNCGWPGGGPPCH